MINKSSWTKNHKVSRILFIKKTSLKKRKTLRNYQLIIIIICKLSYNSYVYLLVFIYILKINIYKCYYFLVLTHTVYIPFFHSSFRRSAGRNFFWNKQCLCTHVIFCLSLLYFVILINNNKLLFPTTVWNSILQV